MNADEAQAVRLVGGEQLLIPFGQEAHLVWTRTNGQTAAVGLIRQRNKTLNVGADGQERVMKFLNAQQAEKLLRKLREKSKFQDFEGKLAQKGKRVGKVRVLFDETNKIAILGIASEGSEKIAHQVRIKVKADKDDEPEDDAEPVIQATACGQASGEAVALGARMQPLALYPVEDFTTGSYAVLEGDYGPQICTSQWGYNYSCYSTTPALSVSSTSLQMATFTGQSVQASVTIWNSGGGWLTGTVSVGAPFSIVSGGSFSLLPGQPQEVVVGFSSATAGSFSRSLTISSNGGTATVTVSGTSYENHFLGELQREDKTLRVGILDSTEAFHTGFFFEPFSAHPLYFWYHFDQRHQELLTTIQFGRERLEGRVKFLQAPVGELNCPILLPSDFEDQQKLQTAYQCLVDAGVRVEISFQFKDYSITLPVLLSSESDYAAVEEAIRQIASRVNPALRDAMQAFKSAFLNNETVQVLSQCILNQVTQTQPSAVRMVTLQCNRAVACFGCIGGIGSYVRGWVGVLTFTPGGAAVNAVIGLMWGALFGTGGALISCPTCVHGCDNSPPPRGGGCSRCPSNSSPTPG